MNWRFTAVYVALILLLASLEPLLADTEPAASARGQFGIRITPYNAAPDDPWEYTRRRGRLSPGSVAFGRIWNRAAPRVLCSMSCPPSRSAAEPAPAAQQQAVNEHETRQLGASVLGIPIVGHYFGTSGSKTLIFGAIHGDEPTTAAVTRAFVTYCARHPDAYAGRRILIVPVLNPDGLARRTRANAREVDLNRNFPAKNFSVGKKGRYFGGAEPASEPETQLLIELIEDWRPDQIITIHSISRGKHGNNFDGPAEALARAMSRHNGYAVLPSIGYSTPGSFGSWAGIDRQIPTITLELPSDASGEDAWQQNREALLAAIRQKGV